MLCRADRGHGFTFVELLVAIALFALTLSFLFPALQRMRDANNAIICANNLRQVGQGLLSYAATNQGVLPTYEVRWPEDDGVVIGYWHALVMQELGISFVRPGQAASLGSTNAGNGVSFGPDINGDGSCDGTQVSNWNVIKIFRCPADDTYRTMSTPPGPGIWELPDGFDGIGTSWYVNLHVLALTGLSGVSSTDSGFYGWAMSGHPLGHFRNTDQRLLMTEKKASDGLGGGAICGTVAQYIDWGGFVPTVFEKGIMDTVYGRHRRSGAPDAPASANVMFLDGHVAMMDVQDICRPAQEQLDDHGSSDAALQSVNGYDLWGGFAH